MQARGLLAMDGTENSQLRSYCARDTEALTDSSIAWGRVLFRNRFLIPPGTPSQRPGNDAEWPPVLRPRVGK